MFSRTIGGFITCAFLLLAASGAAAQQHADFGTLSIQARPADAEVFIDGERWVGSGQPLQVQLAPGTHRVEIRAPGHRPYDADVLIRPGETTPLNVVLPEGGVERTPPPPAGPPAGRAGPPPHPMPPNSRVVEVESEDGVAFAPEFKVADVHGETGTLLGGSVGYVFAGHLFLGGGGYWQLNSTNGWHLTYGGPIVEWRFFPGKTVGVNLRALVGGGALYSDYYHDPYDPYYSPHHHGYYGGYWYSSDAFFVAEPEARVAITVTPFMQIQAGVGYRATSESGMNGVGGSIGLHFGK